MTRILDRARSDLLAWMGSADVTNPRWHEVTTVASGAGWMTEEEAAEVAAAMREPLDRYRRPAFDGDLPGARRVRMSFVLVPVDESDS